jgi:hypothetical protein
MLLGTAPLKRDVYKDNCNYAVLPLSSTGVRRLGGVIMIWRAIAVAVIACGVSGCVTERDGLDFAGLSQKVGPPKPGQARIVVFREQGFGGISDTGWDVKLDGQTLSGLKTGTFVYLDRPVGHHDLASTATLFPGETHKDITVTAGRTYFFLAKPSDRAEKLNAMAAAGGLTGLVIGSALTSGESNPGPLEFFPLEETAARTMIADLRLAPAQ